MDVSWVGERKRSVVLSTGLSLLLSLSLRTMNFVGASVLSVPLGGTGRLGGGWSRPRPFRQVSEAAKPQQVRFRLTSSPKGSRDNPRPFQGSKTDHRANAPDARRALPGREARGKRGLAGTCRPRTRKRPSGSFRAGAAPPTQPSGARKSRFLPRSRRCSGSTLCPLSLRVSAPARTEPGGPRGRGVAGRGRSLGGSGKVGGWPAA